MRNPIDLVVTMAKNQDPPLNPAGPFEPTARVSAGYRSSLIAELDGAPDRWASVANALPPSALDVKYRNWTVRQITHHVADSHTNSYVRFKWALTEDHPTIKSYDEARWVALPDSAIGDIEAALRLLAGVHAKWCQLLRSMSGEDFAASFLHPESNESITLDAALEYYAWHGRHHLGQILWLAEKHDWPVNAG